MAARVDWTRDQLETRDVETLARTLREIESDHLFRILAGLNLESEDQRKLVQAILQAQAAANEYRRTIRLLDESAKEIEALRAYIRVQVGIDPDEITDTGEGPEVPGRGEPSEKRPPRVKVKLVDDEGMTRKDRAIKWLKEH